MVLVQLECFNGYRYITFIIFIIIVIVIIPPTTPIYQRVWILIGSK